MSAQKFEYAEFHFVDPRRITEAGIDSAKVLTVGALINGTLILEGPPATMAQAVNRTIVGLAHSGAARKRLTARATESGGHWQLYYCSLCGARLGRQSCAGCRRRYATDESFSSRRQPALPHKVAVYVQRHTKLRFERQR